MASTKSLASFSSALSSFTGNLESKTDALKAGLKNGSFEVPMAPCNASK